MTDRYYIIWEVRLLTKQVIFHRLVRKDQLETALNEVDNIAIGQVRYKEIDSDNPEEFGMMYR